MQKQANSSSTSKYRKNRCAKCNVFLPDANPYSWMPKDHLCAGCLNGVDFIDSSLVIGNMVKHSRYNGPGRHVASFVLKNRGRKFMSREVAKICDVRRAKAAEVLFSLQMKGLVKLIPNDGYPWKYEVL